MVSDAVFQLWAAIGTWVAALGTVSASVVALWWARRSSRVRLKCHLGINTFFVTNQDPEISDAIFVVSFDFTNLGERPVTITGIGFQHGRWYNRESFTVMPRESGLAHERQLPKTIDHGESVGFMLFESADGDEVAASPCEQLRLTRMRFENSPRSGAYLCRTFQKCRATDDFREALKQELKRKRWALDAQP